MEYTLKDYQVGAVAGVLDNLTQARRLLQAVRFQVPVRAVRCDNTTSAQYLRSIAVPATEMTTIDDYYQALKNGHDAVAFDAPVLRYYAAHDGAGLVEMVGTPFHDEDYGLLFRLRSDLRKPVDGALLSHGEDGTYEALERKWFGFGDLAAGG